MKYEVLITLRAQQEAQSIHDWWAKHRSQEQAARWYEEFWSSFLSLEDNPERCAVAAENGQYPYELRQLNFGLASRPTHRIVFTFRHDRVIILRVRHLAQYELGQE
jgi:plasmid stabilization system protein ParE